jgi:DNA-binding transcriptional LysR family regulator
MSSIIKADGWLGIELRHLAALEAVAREGSFGRAADALGYTQSAVSQQIATLERIVGERLVERPGGPRRISLTAAGTLLLRHAEAIGARLDAAHADLAALRDGETGTLSVGIYQSVGARVLPRLMHRFTADWPGVELNLVEVNADSESDIVSRVERGELDLAFWILPLPESQLESVELLRDDFVLAVPASSPLARRTAARLDDLGDAVLIGHRRCKTTAHVETALRSSGLEPRVAFRSDDNITVQNLVAEGLGVALVARLTLDEADARIRVLEIEPPLPPRRIALCWHRDRHRSPAARAFVDLSVAVCNELTGVPAAA